MGVEKHGCRLINIPRGLAMEIYNGKISGKSHRQKAANEMTED